MHPAVAALAMEEQGFVLGTVLARRTPEQAVRLAGGDPGRWRGALEALLGLPRAARAATMAELIQWAQAPLPGGLERVHPGWLRERLAPEPSDVVKAVTDGLPIELRRVAAELLAERGESAGGPVDCPPRTVVLLRRVIFAGLVPLGGPCAPGGPEARALLDLSFAAVEEAVELRGAATLGTSLRGAPGPVIAQAAAGLGGRLARALLEAASQRGGGPDQRSDGHPERVPGPSRGDSAGPSPAPSTRGEARLLVSAAANELSPPLALRLGLRALALALARESPDAVAAVAQRLRPPLGRRLQALAAAPWD